MAALIAAVALVLGGCPETVETPVVGADATVDAATSDATADIAAETSAPDAATADAGDVVADAGTGTGPQDPPTNGTELQTWLDSGFYEGWVGESAPHTSTGPHFGFVRTFVNNTLLESLQAGNASHPVGAASVKELYGASDAAVLGHAVMVKVQEDSAGGDGWYWYEFYQGSTFADSTGNSTCTGCHSAGSDYVRTPFPLQ